MSSLLRFGLLGLMILSVFCFRWLPHPPNFTPLFAVALFSGMVFRSRLLAFSLPIFLLLVSDIWLGFHSTWAFVYFPLILVVALGMGWQKKPVFTSWSIRVFSGSVLFFFVSNFGVWWMSDLYPPTLEGLNLAFAMGVPFFKNALAGDFFFSALLMGSYQLATRTFRRVSASDPWLG